jgi:hypothetical protein
MTQILDYSTGYPGGAAVDAAGFAGAIRYLRKEGTSSVKPLTHAEVLDFATHSLDLAVVYQHVSKGRVLEGRPAGRHDAQWAHDQAVAEVGAAPRAIYFAVDFDTISSTQWAAVREYMLGAGEVVTIHCVGTYGEYDLLDYLFARDSIAWGWQTYAWSTGHNQANQSRHPRAHLFQRKEQTTVGGVGCDINDVLKADYGQYPSEDTMATAAEIRDEVWGAVFTPPGGTPGQTRTARQLLEDVQGYGVRTENTEAAIVDLQEQVAAMDTKLDQIAVGNIDYATLARAVVAEQDRVARDNDPATGPVT